MKLDRAEMLRQMDPELREVYASLTPYRVESYDGLCAIRAAELMAARAERPARDGVRLEEKTIPGFGEGETVSVRVCRPETGPERLPVLVYFHGGGCIIGSAEQDDAACIDLARRERCVVVNVDYRLAPEFPAPAGQLDGCAAWRWLCAGGADELGVDLERSIFFGGSAGGNMVLGAALRLLDQGSRMPAALVSLYPMLDDRGNTRSLQDVVDDSLWGRDQNARAWEYYLHGLESGPCPEADAYAAPARREHFDGLPPVFTYVGALDLFRDETLELVRKLAADGVPTTFTLYPGCFHAFDLYVPDAQVSRRAREALHTYLQSVFQSVS